jgi:peptidoglycan/LPS O-acetylase OafA/YrhL
MTLFITISKRNHLLVTIAALGLCSLIGILGHFSEVHLTFVTNPILLEFVFGLIIGWVYIEKIKVPEWLVYLLFWASIIWYGLLIFNGYGDISEANFILDGTLSLKRVILWGIPSAMFVTAIVIVENMYPKNSRVLRNRLLLLLGNSSYSIYLIHPIVFSVIISISRFSYKSFNGDLLILLFLTLAVTIGCVVYKFMEKPLLTMLQAALVIKKK